MSIVCDHPEACQEHLADDASTSAGCIRWCSFCGAISITEFSDDRDWKLPAIWDSGLAKTDKEKR